MAANGVDIKIARNDYEQQVLEFRQALYKAMGDVNNAPALRAAAGTRGALQASLALARKSERLNEVRYRQGAVTITDWLNAQEQRRRGAGGGRKPLRAVPEPGENLSGIRRFIGPLI